MEVLRWGREGAGVHRVRGTEDRGDGRRGSAASSHRLLGEIAQAHAGDFGVGVGLSRLGVLDDVEQALDPAREPRGWPRSVPSIGAGGQLLLKPERGGKPIALAIAASLSMPGFSILPLRRLVT